MFNLIKSLLARPPALQLPEPDEWTPADALALNGLLKTEAGKRLSSHLRHLVFSESMRLLSDGNPSKSLEYRVGRAAGIKAAVAYIDALAYVETADDNDHE